MRSEATAVSSLDSTAPNFSENSLASTCCTVFLPSLDQVLHCVPILTWALDADHSGAATIFPGWADLIARKRRRQAASGGTLTGMSRGSAAAQRRGER
jgi:hypothetical protein